MRIKPMKADLMPLRFTPSDHIIERKFDGHRLMVHISSEGALSCWSTQLNNNIHKLSDSLIALMIENMAPGLYDGELHLNEPGETSSQVVLKKNRERLCYTAFDMIGIYVDGNYVDRTNLTLTERKRMLDTYMFSGSRVIVSPFTHLHTRGRMDAYVREMFDQGYEGAIVKDANSLYLPGKRSKNWLKIKRCNHITLTIYGYSEPTTNTEYGIIYLTGKLTLMAVHQGNIRTSVKVPNLRLRQDFLDNWPSQKGREVVIEYQDIISNGSRQLTLRHPRFDRFADE